jgi:cyclohexanecarboxylate-CoA ligase
MPVDPRIVITPEYAARMRATGLWQDEMLVDFLAKHVAEQPDKVAVIDRKSTVGGQRKTYTYRDLDRDSTRVGLALAAEGIEAGDVVAMQLPNWYEAMAIMLGCWKIGAIVNPLMPIFRRRELGFMLDLAETKALIVPREFRGFDHGALAHGLAADLPHLAHVHVLEEDFQTHFLDHAWETETDAAALFATRRPKATDFCQLIYTSGTTGEPKGALHCQNTLIPSLGSFLDKGLTRDDVIFMASPIAHQTGFLVGLMLPVVLGGSVALQDIWDGATGVEIIAAERCTFTMASTPFLADLTHAPNLADHDISSFAGFLCAGAPIPRVLCETAAKRLGCHIFSAWGMTEVGLVTSTYPGDPPEKVFGTDGRSFAEMEVAVFREDGSRADPDEEGDLKARGPATFPGYMKRPGLADFTADGWFDSGDRARMDSDGYIRIVGRTKDIIIRGGENIPVVEVEEVLYRMPEIEAAAIVAMPDERLGELGCAFVQFKPGQSIDFEEMTARLAAAEVARQYWPERLEPIAEMPRTPSGKIQKYVLREQAQGLTSMRR